MSRIARRGGTVALVAIALASCAIQEDGAPRVVSLEDRGGFGRVATGDEATGSSRIYLLSPAQPGEQQQLRAVQRDVPGGAEPLLTSLLAGPNADEQADQLSTAIPAELELQSARIVGRVLNVDVSDAFGELTPEALRAAVAQLVVTGTELQGVERVRLRTNGEEQVWPVGDGGLTDAPLSVYDYPGLVESTQPPFPAIPSADA